MSQLLTGARRTGWRGSAEVTSLERAKWLALAATDGGVGPGGVLPQGRARRALSNLFRRQSRAGVSRVGDGPEWSPLVGPVLHWNRPLGAFVAEIGRLIL